MAIGLGLISHVGGADSSSAGDRLGGGLGARHPRAKALTLSAPQTWLHKKACAIPSVAGFVIVISTKKAVFLSKSAGAASAKQDHAKRAPTDFVK